MGGTGHLNLKMFKKNYDTLPLNKVKILVWNCLKWGQISRKGLHGSSSSPSFHIHWAGVSEFALLKQKLTERKTQLKVSWPVGLGGWMDDLPQARFCWDVSSSRGGAADGASAGLPSPHQCHHIQPASHKCIENSLLCIKYQSNRMLLLLDTSQSVQFKVDSLILGFTNAMLGQRHQAQTKLFQRTDRALEKWRIWSKANLSPTPYNAVYNISIFPFSTTLNSQAHREWMFIRNENKQNH